MRNSELRVRNLGSAFFGRSGWRSRIDRHRMGLAWLLIHHGQYNYIVSSATASRFPGFGGEPGEPGVFVAYLCMSRTGLRRILADRNTGNCPRCCGTRRPCRRVPSNTRRRRNTRRRKRRRCTLRDTRSDARPESCCTANRDRKRSADCIRSRPRTVIRHTHIGLETCSEFV